MTNTINTANTSIIALALSKGTSIKNKSAAKVTGDKVGLDNYSKWTSALEVARPKFHKYQSTKDYNAKMKALGKEAKDLTPFKDDAMDALQAMLDAIGLVNGFALVRSKELLDILSPFAMSEKDELTGEALTVASQIKNYTTQIKGGGNEAFISDLEEKKSAAEENLRLLKKCEGSAKPSTNMATMTAFTKAIERKMGTVINGQLAKTTEEIQAEEDKRKADKKAKAKAYRQAKREAEKAAKAAAQQTTTEATATN